MKSSALTIKKQVVLKLKNNKSRSANQLKGFSTATLTEATSTFGR